MRSRVSGAAVFMAGPGAVAPVFVSTALVADDATLEAAPANCSATFGHRF